MSDNSHLTNTTKKVSRRRIKHGLPGELAQDLLTLEEPLQISIKWFDESHWRTDHWMMTMRTPGDDQDLLSGLLISHGIIRQCKDMVSIEQHDEQQAHAVNHLTVTLADSVIPDWQRLQRSIVAHSSCGICGVQLSQALQVMTPPSLDTTRHWLNSELVSGMPESLRQAQIQFDATGSVHAAGYWLNGKLLAVAEDVGRHNALDKLIGQLYRQSLWQPRGVLILSGRVSFDLMQKAVMAAIPVVVAVGAPSSMAWQVAQQFDITLIGFTRDGQFNLYTSPQRLCGVSPQQGLQG